VFAANSELWVSETFSQAKLGDIRRAKWEQALSI